MVDELVDDVFVEELVLDAVVVGLEDDTVVDEEE